MGSPPRTPRSSRRRHSSSGGDRTPRSSSSTGRASKSGDSTSRRRRCDDGSDDSTLSMASSSSSAAAAADTSGVGPGVGLHGIRSFPSLTVETGMGLGLGLGAAGNTATATATGEEGTASPYAGARAGPSPRFYCGSPVKSPTPDTDTDDWQNNDNNGIDNDNDTRAQGRLGAGSTSTSSNDVRRMLAAPEQACSKDDVNDDDYSEHSVPLNDSPTTNGVSGNNDGNIDRASRSRSLGTGTFSASASASLEDAGSASEGGSGSGSRSGPRHCPRPDLGSDVSESDESESEGCNGSVSFLQFAPSSNASLAGSRVSRATLGAAPRPKPKGKKKAKGGRGHRRNLSFGSFGGSAHHKAAARAFFGGADDAEVVADDDVGHNAGGTVFSGNASWAGVGVPVPASSPFNGIGNASWAAGHGHGQGLSLEGGQRQQQQQEEDENLIILPREGEFIVDTSVFSPKSELGSGGPSPLSSYDEEDIGVGRFGFSSPRSSARRGSAGTGTGEDKGEDRDDAEETTLDPQTGSQPKSSHNHNRAEARSPHRGAAAADQQAKSPHAMDAIEAAEDAAAFKFAVDGSTAAARVVGGCISHNHGNHSCMGLGPLHKVLFQRKGFEKFENDDIIIDESYGGSRQGERATVEEEDHERHGSRGEYHERDVVGLAHQHREEQDEEDDDNGPLPSTCPSSEGRSRSSSRENVDPWGRRRTSREPSSPTGSSSGRGRRSSTKNKNGRGRERQRGRGRSRQSRSGSPTTAAATGHDEHGNNHHGRSRSGSIRRRRTPSLSRALKKTFSSTSAATSNLAGKIKKKPPGGPRLPRNPKSGGGTGGGSRHNRHRSRSGTAADMDDSFQSPSPTAMLDDDEDQSCHNFAVPRNGRYSRSGSFGGGSGSAGGSGSGKLKAVGMASKSAVRKGNRWLLDRLARRGGAAAPRALT